LLFDSQIIIMQSVGQTRHPFASIKLVQNFIAH
jgi:hypothetical protein